jgi:hypothetical protein
MPLFDYEIDQIWPVLWEHKHLWIKKATGLGITEFFLRFAVWLSVHSNEYRGTKFAIVTGPNVHLAKVLIDRIKEMFRIKLNMELEGATEYHVVINGVEIRAYPSMNINAVRSLTNPKFILVDEGDFFLKKDQNEIRAAVQRYHAKSNPWVIFISTPHLPGGLFETMEKEEPSIYHKIFLNYEWGIGKIYDPLTIEKAKLAGTFEQEYNLQYQGKVGNVFNIKDIQMAQTLFTYNPNREGLPYGVSCIMGIDPSPGGGPAGITIAAMIDGKICIMWAKEYVKPDYNQTANEAWRLIQEYNVRKVFIDGSFPSLVRQLKLEWGERPDYDNVQKDQFQFMKVEPVHFRTEHKPMLQHCKFLLEKERLAIDPSFTKLLTALKTASHNNMELDKESTAHDDVLDSFRLCMKWFQERTINQG